MINKNEFSARLFFEIIKASGKTDYESIHKMIFGYYDHSTFEKPNDTSLEPESLKDEFVESMYVSYKFRTGVFFLKPECR